LTDVRQVLVESWSVSAIENAQLKLALMVVHKFQRGQPIGRIVRRRQGLMAAI
jgi:hypothetical protein